MEQAKEDFGATIEETDSCSLISVKLFTFFRVQRNLCPNPMVVHIPTHTYISSIFSQIFSSLLVWDRMNSMSTVSGAKIICFLPIVPTEFSGLTTAFSLSFSLV